MIRKGNNRCRPLDVLEIYAYPNSQLTSVAQSSGLHAERFTFEDGDLSTVAGRVKLLTTVLLKQPRHVWLAPDCGPWSPWSRFNALRSVQGFHRVDQAQLASLVHLKLCNLICKIQLSAGRHAHIENPWTSGIWRRRELEDFLTASLPARLDQCMFRLRHPETKDPMEKKTRVQTSSREMWLELDNRICDKSHEHAPIAGQCHFKGHEIAVSKFAGHYPRTFAKAIVRGIIRSKEGPIEKPIFHVEHLEIEEPPAKRARLEESLPDDSMPDVEPRIDAEPWKPVMDKLKSSLPKSGVQTITNPGLDVFQMVQQVVSNKRIGAIRAGKGLERYIPGEPEGRAEFPYRQTVILHRTSHQIEDLGEENWTVLTKQQQHRKAKSSHVMLCLFFQKVSGDGRDVQNDQVEELDRFPVASQAAPATPGSSPAIAMPPSSVEVPTWTPLSATVFGPKFLQLSDHDKGVIRKLHRNLGHPTANRLARHLTETQASPQLVEGAKDFQCESCAELQAPQKATPGNLKDPKEFNEKISIDGFEWKSQSGLTVYVLHIIDDATRFHIGQRTQRDSQLLTKGVKDMWLHTKTNCT